MRRILRIAALALMVSMLTASVSGVTAFAAYARETVYVNYFGDHWMPMYSDESCTKEVNWHPDDIGTLIVKDNLTAIPDMQFSNWSHTTGISIPETVKSIGKGAFTGTGETEIKLPSGLTSISDDLLSYSADLKSVNIPPHVTSIGSDAFYSCNQLDGVQLPQGLQSIGDGAFSDCRALSGIRIPSTVTSLGLTVFYGCSALTSLVIPDGVTDLKEGVAGYCTSLTSITLPKNLKTIGEGAFQCDDALESIVIPPSVESIEKDAFYGDKLLTISGYDGTVAESYAKANNIPFHSLGAVPAGTYNGANFKGSFTVDTKSYVISPKAGYQIGVQLRGPAVTVKAYSTSASVATVKKLKNGNYQVTGVKAGTAYIMFDVYSQSNTKIAHASVAITVQNGAKSHGDATRQTALYH